MKKFFFVSAFIFAAVMSAMAHPLFPKAGTFENTEHGLLPYNWIADLRVEAPDLYEANKADLDAAEKRCLERRQAIINDDFSKYESYEEMKGAPLQRMYYLMRSKIPAEPKECKGDNYAGEVTRTIKGVRFVDTKNPVLADRLYGLFNFGYADGSYTEIFTTHDLVTVTGKTEEQLQKAFYIDDVEYSRVTDDGKEYLHVLYYFDSIGMGKFSITVF